MYQNMGCNMAKICSIEGCGRAHNAKGFCSLHYERFLKSGDPLFVQKKRPPNFKDVICSVEGCCTPIFSKGLCRSHSDKLKKHGDVAAAGFAFVPRSIDGKAIKCNVDGCEKDVQAKGMCSAHYRRNTLYGGPLADRPLLTKNARRRSVSKDGYVFLSWKGHPESGKNGNVLEHRMVMHERLGRKLLPGENVHHINGKRDDNRPENLELWVTMQPSGQRPEDLVAFAKEILKRYDK